MRTAAKDAAGSLFGHLVGMNNTPEPRMPRVENLDFLDLMGVVSSLCTITSIPTRRSAPLAARVQEWTVEMMTENAVGAGHRPDESTISAAVAKCLALRPVRLFRGYYV